MIDLKKETITEKEQLYTYCIIHIIFTLHKTTLFRVGSAAKLYTLAEKK